MAEGNQGDVAAREDPLMQYILMRKDLGKDKKKGGLGWPRGAVVAQGAHAALAAVAETMDDPDTAAYIAPENLGLMHKAVLSIDNLEQLQHYQAQMAEAGIVGHTWIEQPEGIMTCIATKPYRKSVVSGVFRALKLLR